MFGGEIRKQLILHNFKLEVFFLLLELFPYKFDMILQYIFNIWNSNLFCGTFLIDFELYINFYMRDIFVTIYLFCCDTKLGFSPHLNLIAHNQTCS